MTDHHILGLLREICDRLDVLSDRIEENTARLGHIEISVARQGVQLAEMSVRMDRFERRLIRVERSPRLVPESRTPEPELIPEPETPEPELIPEPETPEPESIPEPEPEPAPEPEPEPAPEPEPEKEEDEVWTSTNRHERRRLERLRRRHDKFVKPGGETPVKTERGEPEQPRPAPQPRPAQVEHDDGHYIIADKHHEDREGENVLYEETEILGEFNFRDTILEQLERYSVYLERMKRHDNDAYQFYKKIGATVLPYGATGSYDRYRKIEREDDKTHALPEWFIETRPAFGCFVYGADPETEKYEGTKQDDGKTYWVPKFMYFTKHATPPPHVQHISGGGDFYTMTVWWDRPLDKKIKYGYPNEFGIHVSADGKKVVALKELRTRWQDVNPRHKKGRGKHHSFQIPRREWKISSSYEKWAKDNGKDAAKFLADLFVLSVQKHTFSQASMIRVAATKDGITAVFGVNVKRTAYFFQDRDVHLTESGAKRKVFHMVRPHSRVTGAHVRFHFRGEREFTWAGYQIMITVPGRDHFMLDEFDIPAVPGTRDEKKYMDTAKVGDMLVENIRKGLGGAR